MEKHRIGLLDGFRFVAVTMVVLYHLTSPLAVKNAQAGISFPVFRYGYLGVEFFFIISGFVISYSLENTATISTFFLHRFRRLFPAMLLYSLITFAVIGCLDTADIFKNAHYARNLLPGGAVWTGFGIGRTEFPMVAQAWLLGGHVRVGMEDNLYMSKGVLAKSNAELVAHAAGILRLLGAHIASAKDARAMLKLA